MTRARCTIRIAALLFLLAPAGSGAGQESVVQDGRGGLRVTVVLTGRDRTAVPVASHMLLVSNNPPTASPRVLQTGPDGIATVRLRPGTYTVESDQPATFDGKAYQWRQEVDIAAGRETLLALTAENAEVAAAFPSDDALPAAPAGDASTLLSKWAGSVVPVWSPTARGSGFVVDRRGLVVTSQRVIAGGASAEVQVAPAVKLAARVLVADPARHVAVLWIDPTAAAAAGAIALDCARPASTSPVSEGQEVIALGAPLRRGTTAASGTVDGIEGRFIVADIFLEPGGVGGPVFTGDGRLVGISAPGGERDDGREADPAVVRIEEACAALSAAELAMTRTATPEPGHLPQEPSRAFPVEASLQKAAPTAIDVKPYRLSSSAYDVTFITPVLLHSAEQARDRARGSGRGAGGPPDPRTIDPLDDFANWSAYIRDRPPVLMIRVTPRLVEGFWTRVARGAAQTQGVSLPPIKRFKPGFARLRAFCGTDEVIPIHPFKIVQRVNEAEAIHEGLYVFDPGALGPSCGNVRLVLYREDEPAKGDSRVVEERLLRQIWEDFAPYRSLK